MTEMKFIDIHGECLAVRDEGDGEALLLIHGMAGSSQTWRAILPTARSNMWGGAMGR